MNFNIFLCEPIPGITYVSLGVAALSVVMSIVMICAYVATRNAVIDIVTSFEMQNSKAYEIRVDIFNRAIAFLFNIESKQIDTNTKKIQAGEIFDNLLIVSSNKDTLSVFEKIIKVYSDQGMLDIKLFNKFKTCVRREFGAKAYVPKSIYSFAIPSGKVTVGNYANPKQYVEGAPVRPNGPKAPIPQYKTPVQQANGATIVTQSQTDTKSAVQPNPAMRPVPPVNPGVRPVPPVPPIRPVPPVTPGVPASQKPVSISSMVDNNEAKPETETKTDAVPDNVIMAKPDDNKNDDKE